MKEIKRERVGIQSELLVIGEAGGIGSWRHREGKKNKGEKCIIKRKNEYKEKLKNQETSQSV